MFFSLKAMLTSSQNWIPSALQHCFNLRSTTVEDLFFFSMFNCLYRNGMNAHNSLHVAFGIVVDHMLFTLELVSLDTSWPVFCRILSKEMGGQILDSINCCIMNVTHNPKWKGLRQKDESHSDIEKKHVTEWDDCHSYCAKHNRPCSVLQQWPLPRFFCFL